MTLEDGSNRVQVAWTDIATQVDEDTVGEIFVVFRPNGAVRWLLADDPYSMDAAVAARQYANGVIAYENTNALSVSPSPYGPIVELEHPEDEYVAPWITAFADHLSSSGLSGVVEPAPHTWMDQWLEDEWNRPKVTALHAYTLDRPPSREPGQEWTRPTWSVNSTVTTGICSHATQWCSSVQAADVYVSQGKSQVILSQPLASRELAATLLRDEKVGMMHARRLPMAVRRTYMSAWGQVGYQVHEPALTWRARLEIATETLTQQPSQLDLAIVRLTKGWVRSWLELDRKDPPLPWISEGDWRTNQSLWDRFAPDAHGVQVLTEAHLTRAHDLAKWDVEEIAPERYLVQAKDLEPWFAGDYPDLDVLAAARNDFGDMILTPEAISEYGRP